LKKGIVVAEHNDCRYPQALEQEYGVVIELEEAAPLQLLCEHAKLMSELSRFYLFSRRPYKVHREEGEYDDANAEEEGNHGGCHLREVVELNLQNQRVPPYIVDIDEYVNTHFDVGFCHYSQRHVEEEA